MVSPVNICISNVIQDERSVFVYLEIYVCIHKDTYTWWYICNITTSNLKRGNKFKREQEGAYGGFGGMKGKGEMI